MWKILVLFKTGLSYLIYFVVVDICLSLPRQVFIVQLKMILPNLCILLFPL